jgi:hypothetical protein
MMEWTAKRFRELGEAMRDAFPDEGALATFAAYRLRLRLSWVAEAANHSDRVRIFLEWALASGHLDRVFAEALQANPRNPQLCALVERLAVEPPGDEPRATVTVPMPDRVRVEPLPSAMPLFAVLLTLFVLLAGMAYLVAR